MRKITEKELKAVQDILDLIRPVVDIEMVYIEEENILLLGDNYIIRGLTKKQRGVESNTFLLSYGSDHPGDEFFDLDRWEEEDIAISNSSVECLLPSFVSNLMGRLVEEKVYSGPRFNTPILPGKVR